MNFSVTAMASRESAWGRKERRRKKMIATKVEIEDVGRILAIPVVHQHLVKHGYKVTTTATEAQWARDVEKARAFIKNHPRTRLVREYRAGVKERPGTASTKVLLHYWPELAEEKAA
jgi:hypothetical protein